MFDLCDPNNADKGSCCGCNQTTLSFSGDGKDGVLNGLRYWGLTWTCGWWTCCKGELSLLATIVLFDRKWISGPLWVSWLYYSSGNCRWDVVPKFSRLLFCIELLKDPTWLDGWWVDFLFCGVSKHCYDISEGLERKKSTVNY